MVDNLWWAVFGGALFGIVIGASVSLAFFWAVVSRLKDSYEQEIYDLQVELGWRNPEEF